ncbi:enterotoxin, partial [Streptomyces sp. MCAF7]
SLGTSQDICYPDVYARTEDPRLTRYAAERRAQGDLIGTVALADPIVCAAAMQVNTLSGATDALESQAVQEALHRAGELTHTPEPTLSGDESRVSGLSTN